MFLHSPSFFGQGKVHILLHSKSFLAPEALGM